MKTIWDWAVSAPYGYSTKYEGFHYGEDRGSIDAFNVPVTVNNIAIGSVGWTGYVLPANKYGTHLHAGKWQGGQSFAPEGGGAWLGQDAIVVDVDRIGNTKNGKFVRVRSGGYDWVYLHLNTVNVNVGDKLQGEIMAGVKLVGTPASVSWGKGRIDVFGWGTDNGLWHKWFSEKGWSEWVREGDCASSPSVTSWEAQRLDVFFTGVAGDLVHLWYNGKWNGPESLGQPKKG